MEALSYIIVGSGFRAEFYARIANTYPQQFRAMFFCRSEEKSCIVYGNSMSAKAPVLRSVNSIIDIPD